MTAIANPPLSSIRNMQCEKTIALNLGDQRRRSFLPDNWGLEEKGTSTIKRPSDLMDYNEDDDVYMYMHRQTNEQKPLEKFVTGSKYLGQWNQLGMAGKGIYKYPHGVIYDGYFNRNGEFHGTGILVYPSGQRIEGVWKNGKLGADCTFVAAGGVVMNKNYCLMPDRRFQIEIKNDFNPVGQEYLTDEAPPPRQIPEGCYDVVEGFYDPNIKSVIDYAKKTPGDEDERSIPKTRRLRSSKYLFSKDDPNRSTYAQVSIPTESEIQFNSLIKRTSLESKKVISWIPSIAQEDWITKSCRKEWDEGVGYRPDLYEEWSKGGNTDHCEFNHAEADSKYQLKSLNLHSLREEGSATRFTSFVQTKAYVKEASTVERLSRMFSRKSEKDSVRISTLPTIAYYRYSLESELMFEG